MSTIEAREKLLQTITSHIQAELYDYSYQPQPDEESNESGILEGRNEFANQLWEIINKKGEANG